MQGTHQDSGRHGGILPLLKGTTGSESPPRRAITGHVNLYIPYVNLYIPYVDLYIPYVNLYIPYVKVYIGYVKVYIKSRRKTVFSGM